jgi:multiple sugar transport system permease protein
VAERSGAAGATVPGVTGVGRLPTQPVGTSTGTGSRPSGQRRLQQELTGWGFALPFVLVFTLFLAGPIAASLVMSFTDFGLRDLRNPLGTDFVGLANYQALLEDPKFRKALFNTAYFVIVGVPVTLVLGLGAALALDRGIRRFRTVFRVGYYLPVVTSIVAIAVVWRFLLNPDQGLINLLLAQVGIDGPNWLGDPTLAMPSIIAMAAWRNLGFAMIVFLAGLQTIPAQLYEAASIDGAGRWQAFRNVTLPLLRPTILFLVVITTIGYLQLFEEPFVMTEGGPVDQTLSISMYMYQQGFEFFNQGYAAAIAWILFILVAIVAVVQFRLLRSET